MSIEIDRSPNDDRSYRFIKLENELRVILVLDPETTKSSASLQVGVGSSLDPEKFPGLAHFLEHMLFLGTEKYPVEDAYSKHWSDFGGYSNAFTDIGFTNYHFEVSNEGFDTSLDMFAQFFISPLFTDSSVDKEMNAVNSEHEKNIQNDAWRFLQLLCDESNPKSALNRFATGSLETLQKEGWVEALKEFHKKWYSSNIMNLVVYSNKQLDELEKQVRDLFTSVENKNVVVPSFADPPLYPDENLGYLFKVKPIKNKNTLVFHWYYDDWREKDVYYKTMSIASHVLGHEGENSLWSYLMKEDLITELITYNDDKLSAISYFVISLTLTDKGLERYERVIEIVMKMIQNLQQEGPVEHVYYERSRNYEIKWQFLDKNAGCGFTVMLAQNMYDDSIVFILNSFTNLLH